MADPNKLQARLQALNDAYAAQLPEKLKQIEQVWGRLPKAEWVEVDFESLHRMVHSLTGSGKTFGFSLLSDVARGLEQYLKQLMQARTVLSEEQREHIQGLMLELHQVAQHRDTAFDD
jgi:HPt (histidine-containing phosphotransfer) domain-containing protein